MKIIGVTAAVLCLLTVSCQNEPTTNQTSGDAATSATATDTATANSLRAAPAGGPTLATDLTVNFVGMVTFVLPSAGVQRAVVLRVPGHNQKITFPLSMKTEVEAMFKKTKCGVDCPVDFDNVAFQIVDENGTASSTPFGGFSSEVTHLSKVPLPASVKDTFDAANIEKDVTDKPKKSALIGGFFDIAGGTGSVTPFTCKAHFGADAATSQSFTKFATVTFHLSPKAKLQVSQGGGAWTDLVTLTALPAPLKFTVDNNMPGAVSHFDNYALLSTKRVNGKKVKLPDVTKDDPKCIEGSGDVPGCSDTQWP